MQFELGRAAVGAARVAGAVLLRTSGRQQEQDSDDDGEDAVAAEHRD